MRLWLQKIAMLAYRFLLLLLLPLMWRKGAAQDAQRNRERFGCYDAGRLQKLQQLPAGQCLWIHAASMGESLLAINLVKALQQQSATPLRIIITTTTSTGREQIDKHLADSVVHFYAPYDASFAVKQFIRQVRPDYCFLIETELWPNTLALCHEHKIPVVLINGRLSQKSMLAYQRFALLTKPMLKNLHSLLIQNAADAERFQQLGVDSHKLHVTGSIKFDLQLDASVRERAMLFRQRWHSEFDGVWLVASTHEGEEAQIIDVWKTLQPQYKNWLLVMVPRHPQRFDQVAALLDANGLSYQRQSTHPEKLLPANILLGDVMGELLACYGASDITTVGGSLVDIGGHNLIEPAAWQLPITTGPYLRNFRDIADQLLVVDGLQMAESSEQLGELMAALMESSALRQRMGEAAGSVAQDNRGALQRTVSYLVDSIIQ